MTGSEESRTSAAEELFAEFLEAQEAQGQDFDGFCEAHAEYATELRAIHRALNWAGDVLEPDDGPELPGFHVGHERYEVLGEVARGGMGVVLRVRDLDLRRDLAMKVVHPERVQKRAVARFTEEAQVTSQLEHPSIVPVHDIGTLGDGRVYYTMPLVRGRDLGQVIRLAHARGEEWSTTRVLGVLLRVCEAVSAAHERGVIHRDLKPANVMVGPHGEVYVMDWGLARLLGADSERGGPALASSRQDFLDEDPESSIGTLDGQVVGTPSYMPPEQASGDLAAIGRHSDVYAVGAMLYETICGRPPYRELDETPSTRTVLDRVLSGPPEPISAPSANAPAELVAICERAMKRDPRERYPDMAALGNDLRAYLEGRVVSAYRTGAVAELVKWVGRNRGLAAAFAAIFAGLVAGVIIFSQLKDEAEVEARRATAHFESALEAVEQLLSEVGSGDLVDVPGAQAARTRLLERAAAFYERFLVAEGDDRESRLRVVRAHKDLFNVYNALGDSTAALEATDRALEELVALSEDFPGDREIARRSAFQLLDRAISKASARDFASARADLEAGLRAAETLRGAAGSMAGLAGAIDVDLEVARARMIYALGNTLWRQGEVESAQERFQEAIATHEELIADERFGSVRSRLETHLSEALTYYGYHLFSSRQFAECVPFFARAVELRERIAANSPEAREPLLDLAESLGNLAAGLSMASPGSEQGQQTAERSLEVHLRLVEDFPNIPRYLSLLAGVRMNRAMDLADAGEHERAQALIEVAIGDARRAWERQPGVEDARMHLVEAIAFSFRVYLAAGQHEAAVARVPDFVALDPERQRKIWTRAAFVYAYASYVVANDGELADDRREDLLDGYGREMARCLDEAWQAGDAPLDLTVDPYAAARDHPAVQDHLARRAAAEPSKPAEGAEE